MDWHDITAHPDDLPDFGKEVVIWVDGHRGPAWRNSHGLVAYYATDGQWWEERHDDEPLIGVTHWARFTGPNGEEP